jgi:hypothetical protein
VDSDEANAAVGTRVRVLDRGVFTYLMSRSSAGATHADIIRGISALTPLVTSTFHSYSDVMSANDSFIEWCYEKMVNGYILILTMNFQKEDVSHENEWIADAWHHQMVFGADKHMKCLYLTNPICRMFEADLHKVLDSESVLLIRDEDLWRQTIAEDDVATVARSLEGISSEWCDLKVSTRYLEIIESKPIDYKCESPRNFPCHYLTIPASYTTGVTAVRRHDS